MLPSCPTELPFVPRHEEFRREAMFYEPWAGATNGVRCTLCHQYCEIRDGEEGFCHVRENTGGKLYTLVYGMAAAAQIDGIERKRMFHVCPGTTALSLATPGCNLQCRFCQNWDLSQPQSNIHVQSLMPDAAVAVAKEHGCRTIAFSYTEPTVFFEYALDVARAAGDQGITNVLTTNGYMTAEALRLLAPYVDAATVDVKCFYEDVYRHLVYGELRPVLDNVRLLKKLGIWLEITTPVIPGVNDDDNQLYNLAAFIAELGPETPWHLGRFYPDLELSHLPTTSAESLRRARAIGQEAGLRYVYCGNLLGEEAESTYCHSCCSALIRRFGGQVVDNVLQQGACPHCHTPLPGVF